MNQTINFPLLELKTAYRSLRDSGFDFPTAIGELIDNAVQANATRIDILPTFEVQTPEGAERGTSVITQVAVIDNGDGMDKNTLNGCPQLGYSTRYNNRRGLGRFGVGATLAAISQCKRITICSRPHRQGKYLATYVDLDEIAESTQTSIPEPSSALVPTDLSKWAPDKSSTVVLWEKCDRLQQDANGRPIRAKTYLNELKSWVSRAYRYMIWDGLEIYLHEGKNVEQIKAHDPLYLNTSQTLFPGDEPATIAFEHKLEWPIPNVPEKTSVISIKMTLLPEVMRPKRGAKRKEATERRIDENEGISVLRHKREVAFGNFYPMVPSADRLDRWWGCEINFEPELDECWEVRNVKRGARPTKELREELAKVLKNQVSKLRKKIRGYWDRVEAQEAHTKGAHSPAEEIVREVETRTKPAVQAGLSVPKKVQEEQKKEIIQDPDLTPIEREVLSAKVEGPNPLPISIKTKAMTGSEFMETHHIGNNQMVLTFNKSHPFFREVYSELEKLEADNNRAARKMALQIRRAVDLLLMAYGRAESMIDLDNEEINGALAELKSYWGVQLRKYIQEITREKG